jgi:hypothetical protein
MHENKPGCSRRREQMIDVIGWTWLFAIEEMRVTRILANSYNRPTPLDVQRLISRAPHNGG